MSTLTHMQLCRLAHLIAEAHRILDEEDAARGAKWTDAEAKDIEARGWPMHLAKHVKNPPARRIP